MYLGLTLSEIDRLKMLSPYNLEILIKVDISKEEIVYCRKRIEGQHKLQREYLNITCNPKNGILYKKICEIEKTIRR